MYYGIVELECYKFTAVWEGDYNGHYLEFPFQYSIHLAPGADEDLLPGAAKAVLISLVSDLLSCKAEEDV